MSLKHILLGMLHEPHSGYDLKKEFDSSLQHFWAAELSQIYPLLKRMEEEGLLKSHREESDRGPDRKVYRRTAKGTRTLVGWLADGPNVRQERRNYLAQVYFLEAMEPHQALDFMRQLRAEMAGRRDTLEAAHRDMKVCTPDDPADILDPWFYPYLTLQLGRRVFAANVAWCDEAIVLIEARANGPATPAR